MRIRQLVFSAIACVLPWPAAHATVYAVGCNGLYSLLDAINLAVADPDGPHVIRLGGGSYLINPYSISDPLADISIEGGYASCGDDEPAPGARATVNANGDQRMLYISNALDHPRRTVTLRHLLFTGGNIPSDPLGGGALFAFGNVTLELLDTRIEGNAAENGGGIGLLNLGSDGATRTRLVIAQGSRINDNEATGTINSTGNGGGIYALGAVDIVLEDGEISGNSARRAGGAVALNSSLVRLSFLPLGSDESFVINANTAGRATFVTNEGFGGAIYSNGADIDTSFSGFRSQYQLYLLGNLANYGGAIYVAGDAAPGAGFTFVRLLNAVVGYNEARGKGGAFYSANAVDFTLDHQALGKCPLFVESACSLVIANFADNEGTPGTPGGGAFYLTGEAGSQRGIARVRRTYFNGNQDADGSVAVGFADAPNEFFIERSIFRNNVASLAASGVLLRSSAPTRVLYSDLLDNTVARLFDFRGDTLNVQGSILADPGTPIWYHTVGAQLQFNGCLVSNTASDIPAGAQIGTPLLDADFVPQRPYPAVDACDDFQYAAISDIYGQAPHDVPGIMNYYGGNDLGAVEQTDMIFHGGFGVRPTD